MYIDVCVCVYPMCSHAHAETLGLSRKIKKNIREEENLYRNSIDAFCLHLCICICICVCVSVRICVSAAIKLQFWTEACIAFWHHLAKNEIEVLRM